MRVKRSASIPAGPLLALALLAACTSGPEPANTLAVSYSGCARLEAGPHCWLAPGNTLRLWLPVRHADQVSVQLGQQLIDVASHGQAINGGWRIALPVEQLPTTMQALSADGQFRLRLSSTHGQDSIETYLEDFQQQTLPSRLQQIDLALDRAAAPLRGHLLRLRAGTLLRLQRWPEAMQSLGEASAAHQANGQLAAAIQQTTSLAYFLTHREDDYVGANKALASTPAPLPGDADSAIYMANSHGDLSLALGDLAGAEARFKRALQTAEQIDHSAGIATARVGLARSLAQSGRFAHSVDVLAVVNTSQLATLSSCDQARFLNTRAWLSLLHHEAGGPPPQVEADLSTAATLLGQQCPQLTTDRSNVAINQALAALIADQISQSRGYLQHAQSISATLPALQQAWIDEIEARIALRSGDTSAALGGFRTLASRARLSGLLEVEWRAAMGEAEVHLARRDPNAAIAILERADRLLRHYLTRLPGGRLRATYLARFESLPKTLLTLLIEQQRYRDAWQLGRYYRVAPLLRQRHQARIATLHDDVEWQKLASRYRRLRQTLEQSASETWQIPTVQLAAHHAQLETRNGELLAIAEAASTLTGIDQGIGTADTASAPGQLNLMYLPGRDHWLALAYDEQGFGGSVLPLSSDQLMAQPQRLLQPFAAQVEAAQQIRLLSYGALQQVDLHAALWRGQPLLARKAVSYGTDTAQTAKGWQHAPRHILLVGDPRGDLPHARRELGQVSTALRQAAGAAVTTLIGSEADPTALRTGLNRADWFHYAGHAEHHAGQGELPGFPLSDGQQFSLADILMLDRAPNTAVLAGCATAANPNADTAPWSLAHAFVLRGSQRVVATSRSVTDQDAAVLTAALYRHLASGLSIEHALLTAQRELIGANAPVDWAAFRLYVP